MAGQLARSLARKRTRRARLRPSPEQRDEAKHAQRATANRILAVLRAILNKAFEDKKARDESEWRRVPFPKVDVPRIRFLTEG